MCKRDFSNKNTVLDTDRKVTNSIFAFEKKLNLRIFINKMQIENQIIKFVSKETEKPETQFI